MSSWGYRAPPTSWATVAEKAWQVRLTAGLDAEPYFPVMPFLERVLDNELGLVELQIYEDADCEGAEGLTCLNGTRIVLPQSVYVGASEGSPRDRFTVAHELGHFFLHTQVSLARTPHSGRVRPFENPEVQANRFAAELLMPFRLFRDHEDVESVCERFGVSASAATNRLKGWKVETNRAARRRP